MQSDSHPTTAAVKNFPRCQGADTVTCCKDEAYQAMSDQYRQQHRLVDFTSLAVIVVFTPTKRFEFYCGVATTPPSTTRTDVVGPFSMDCKPDSPGYQLNNIYTEGMCVALCPVHSGGGPPMPPMAAVLARNVWGTSGGQSMSRQMRGSPGLRPSGAHCPIHSSPHGQSGGMPRPFMYGQPGRPGFNPYGRQVGQPGWMPGAGCASGACGNMGTQPMYGQPGGSPRFRPPYPYPQGLPGGQSGRPSGGNCAGGSCSSNMDFQSAHGSDISDDESDGHSSVGRADGPAGGSCAGGSCSRRNVATFPQQEIHYLEDATAFVVETWLSPALD